MTREPAHATSPVGRDAQFAAARRRSTRSRKEGPAAIVLTGTAGIGKTTLWRAVIADARLADT